VREGKKNEEKTMTTKRTVNGQKFNVAQIVDEAIAAADGGKTLNFVDAARRELVAYGHRNPDDETVMRYARERAILRTLGNMTGANFENQIGKISFSGREQAIADVESYLNRRIQGQHARWTSR
jgi:hypothetical protein